MLNAKRFMSASAALLASFSLVSLASSGVRARMSPWKWNSSLAPDKLLGAPIAAAAAGASGGGASRPD